MKGLQIERYMRKKPSKNNISLATLNSSAPLNLASPQISWLNLDHKKDKKLSPSASLNCSLQW
jgi:hypothetical protein